jgi:A/G-specific adenine glycosylase
MPEQAVLRHLRAQTGLDAAVGQKIAVVRHGYTTHRVTLSGFFCEIRPGSPAGEGLWVRPEELAGRAFPAGSRKLLEHLGWK